MKKIALTVFVGLMLGACTSSVKSKPDRDSVVVGKGAVKPAVIQKSVSVDSAKLAKDWFLSNAARFFKEQSLKDDTVMFSQQYLEYKHDAIGREFDGLTEKQFADKWKDKYNTKLANMGSILIGQQDWIAPKVTTCNFKNKTADKGFIFRVIIEDGDGKDKLVHKRYVKVVPLGNTFIIDDILEYDY